MRSEPFKEALGSDRGHQGGVVYPQCVVSLTGTNRAAQAALASGRCLLCLSRVSPPTVPICTQMSERARMVCACVVYNDLCV